MNRFQVPSAGLDVRLSVTCGQVFRWRQVSDDTVVGADGPHWWSVTSRGSHHEVEGSGSLADFERLFRIGEPWADHRTEVWDKAPEMRPALAALDGLRLMRPSDPVEVAFAFLCTSNNHLSRIHGMVDRLAARGPWMREANGHEVRRFPDLDTLARLNEAELRAEGFGYRAATIPVAARQILDRGGLGWLEGLKSAPREEARSALLELAGVGPKLADCICLFALWHDESVPVDTHVWQAAVRSSFPEWSGKSLTAARYALVAESFRTRFGPLAGWAHQFCFYGNLVRAWG